VGITSNSVAPLAWFIGVQEARDYGVDRPGGSNGHKKK
jgi:hypothetical protein